MSKKPNQAVKEIKGTTDMLEKVMLADYGLKAKDKMFHDADALVHFIKHAAWLESQPLPPEQPVFEATKLHRDAAWNSLVKQTLAAFKSGDGAFFHAMADAIHLNCNPTDPARAFIFAQIGSRKAFKKRLPTQAKLKEQLEKLGLPTDRRTVSRIVKESGQKLPKGKCGPNRNRKRK
jgi:hypothetical protein